MGGAEDLDDAGQRGVGAGAYVQRRGGQPGCVDADHLSIAGVQLSNSATGLTGQVTSIYGVPLQKFILISCV